MCLIAKIARTIKMFATPPDPVASKEAVCKYVRGFLLFFLLLFFVFLTSRRNGFPTVSTVFIPPPVHRKYVHLQSRFPPVALQLRIPLYYCIRTIRVLQFNRFYHCTRYVLMSKFPECLLRTYRVSSVDTVLRGLGNAGRWPFGIHTRTVLLTTPVSDDR